MGLSRRTSEELAEMQHARFKDLQRTAAAILDALYELNSAHNALKDRVDRAERLAGTLPSEEGV